MKMVSVVKGLTVQKSRFAALSLDQDSDEEEGSQAEWQHVAPAKSKLTAQKKRTEQGNTEDKKTMSKSAKKRARKRRNKSTSSDREGDEVLGEAQSDVKPLLPANEDQSGSDAYQEMWKKKNEQAMEEEFQKELREALILSSYEAKAPKKLVSEGKETEEKAKASKKGAAKKPVKLSLQDLHRVSSTDLPVLPPLQPPRTHTSSSDEVEVFAPSVEDAEFSPFMEDVEAEIKKEMKKKSGRRYPSEEEMKMMPRIAQLEDELEKKDKAITRLKKDNLTLKKSLAEVKERNQSLCSIMSHGEFSEKADLLKQVEELSTVKNDLTLEVETLSSALEQERTRSKALKAELTKVQNSLSRSSKN